jgi:hypothetical protein
MSLRLYAVKAKMQSILVNGVSGQVRTRQVFCGQGAGHHFHGHVGNCCSYWESLGPT